MNKTKKIVLPGGAGLVGQNLVTRLLERGYHNIVVVDKHKINLNILQELHPNITTQLADLSQAGEWQQHFQDADVVVMLQAQIGGTDLAEFKRNNVESTQQILTTLKENPHVKLIHISSSVVDSIAEDFYTITKKEQEKIVQDGGINCPILRPTLMYGWFDRKHLGWLSRFMQKAPIFPIPGHGRYMRQPLYVGDFCQIIISCLENEIPNDIYKISGQEKINYIDIIRKIKSATHSRTPIIKIPYRLFYSLLWLWECFDKNPPFTTQQLAALCAKDEFEIIDWPNIFSVPCTPFNQAIDETFNHPIYSKIILEF